MNAKLLSRLEKNKDQTELLVKKLGEKLQSSKDMMEDLARKLDLISEASLSLQTQSCPIVDFSAHRNLEDRLFKLNHILNRSGFCTGQKLETLCNSKKQKWHLYQCGIHKRQKSTQLLHENRIKETTQMLIESKLKNFDIRPVYERNPDFASDSCGAKVLQSSGDIYVKNSFFGKSTHANLDRDSSHNLLELTA